MQNHGALGKRLGALSVAQPTQGYFTQRIPREIACSREGELLSIKWGNSWHAHTCQCSDCIFIAESFARVPE